MNSRINVFGYRLEAWRLSAFFIFAAITVLAAWSPEWATGVLLALGLKAKGAMVLATSFPTTNCSGRLVTVDASTGCTLTRASVTALTPERFAANDMIEIGMDRYYNQLQEARMAGYVENSWQSLLMSRIANMKGALQKRNIVGGPSVIFPFVQKVQSRNINTNYWKVASGTPNAARGTGDMPVSAWDLVIQNNPSTFASTLTNLHQYFLPGTYLFVEYTKSDGTTAYSNQYKIIAASTTAGTCTVTVAPNYTDAGWLALSAGAKLPYQIGGVNGGNAEAGTLAFLGVNAVSDYESWGGQDNAELANSILNYPIQTSRIVHEYDDAYLEVLNDSMISNYFHRFRSMPLAKQKAIQQAKYDAKMLNSCWFGQKINEKQAVETYYQLPSVKDPARPDCVLEYKSMAEGFWTQLVNCSRVTDVAGGVLSLNNLFSNAYNVKRARQADGTFSMDEEPVIDIITDPTTAGQIRDLFIRFYKAKWTANIERFYNPNQKLMFDNQVMFKYSTYQVPDELGGFTLAVFSSEALRDKLSAAAGVNRQRYIFMIDWTDVVLGILESNSAVRKTNDMDEIYNYVMKINYKHITMNSMTWCPMIEDPNRHYAMNNFSANCPTLTVAACDVTEA